MLFLCDLYRIFILLQLWFCRGLASSTKSRENGSKGRIMKNQVSLRNIVKTKTQVKHPQLNWKSSYKKTFFWSCNWSYQSGSYLISMMTGLVCSLKIQELNDSLAIWFEIMRASDPKYGFTNTSKIQKSPRNSNDAIKKSNISQRNQGSG